MAAVADPARGSIYPMLEMDVALDLVRAAALSARTSVHDLDICAPEALGCVLAEDARSPAAVPPVPCSRVDGYALRAGGGPGRYSVAARHRPGIAAGGASQTAPLAPGAAAWVTTGGAVPRGADAVVPVEGTAPVAPGATPGAEAAVDIVDAVQPGDNVRPAGSDVAAGETLVRAGAELGAGDVAALLSCGIRRVRAWRRPVVGILSSGDEIVDAAAGGAGAADGAVIDSNRPVLAHVLRAAAASVVDLGIVADCAADVAAALEAAASTCDVVVTTGGVSMGDRDFVKPLLGRLGRVVFGRLNMKPGKPTTLAVLERPATRDAASASDGGRAAPPATRRVLVFALPGNPVSAWVGAHVLVAPALRHMAGVPWAAALPPSVPVRLLDARLPLDAERPEFHRATVWAASDAEGGGLVARSTGPQASSRTLSLSGANALLWLPPARAGGGAFAGPALVRALLIGPVLAEGAVDAAVRGGSRAAPAAGGGGGGDCRCGRAAPLPPFPGPSPFAPHVAAPAEHVPVALCVLTVSDRCSRGVAADTSGPAIVRHLTAASPRLAVRVVECACVADDETAIYGTVARWCGVDGRGGEGSVLHGPAVASLVITTGGTGFGLRDVTPEALRPLLRRPAPGLVHAMLEVGRAATPLAALSRYEAGVAGAATLVIEMPGSAKAVAECLGALDPLLPHVLALLSEAPPGVLPATIASGHAGGAQAPGPG